MRDYSKVSPQFWIGATGKKLRAKGIECQLVSLYLMTCSHANMLGMYYLPKVYIAHECGLDLEGANKGLQSAIEAGFCAYDDASEMVWVYEMAVYQIGEQLKSEDKRVLGVQNEYNTIPECPYLLDFFTKYKDKFCLTSARGIKAPNKPLESQEQEQEQAQEHLTGAETRAGTAAEESDGNKKTKVPGSGETWKAYSDAYLNRYGTEPVRNAKVNSLVVQFVKRIGETESPHVASFFVTHNNSYYVKQMHSLDCLVKDAEKIRTEWATNTQMTGTQAIQIDKTQTNLSAFAPLLAEAQAQELAHGINQTH